MSLCLNETSSHLTVSKTIRFSSPVRRRRTRKTKIDVFVLLFPSNTLFDFLPSDFLGRTEIRLAEIKKDQGSKGPITKRLLLHEVPTGEIVVRLDLQLFEEP